MQRVVEVLRGRPSNVVLSSMRPVSASKAYKRLVAQIEAADAIISDKDKTIAQLEQRLMVQVIN